MRATGGAAAGRPARLLVIIPDRLSDLIAKGEVQPRYYNPGNVFEEVAILSTTADRPDPAALQYMVGDARLSVHFHPSRSRLVLLRPEGARRLALRLWARRGVALARAIAPDLVRCHGADWNAWLAGRIKAALGVPYVVSLHINPDVNAVRRHLGPRLTRAQAWHNRFYERLEGEGLRHADLVMPVYRSILPYLARHGVERVEVCYNVLNGPNLRPKTDYALGAPPRLVCVGRLIAEKDPANIIRAVAGLPPVELTIVGDGPRRPALEALAAELGVADRVRFLPAVPNDALCRMLPQFDLFVVHTEYWELNKSVLEALLTGLPVIINRRKGAPVPELDGADFVHFVDNSEADYRAAIATLLEDHAGREALGRRAFAHAQAHWAPTLTEAKYAAIYRRFLDRASARAA